MDKKKEKLRQKRYYETHREKCIASSKAWYNANKEKAKASQKAWQKANPVNPEKRKVAYKSWYEAHKEKIIAGYKTYREAHKVERRLSRKKWEKANPEKMRLYRRKKRARKRTTQVEPINEKIVYLRDGWKCQICHKKVDKRFKYPNPKSASLDHIIPLSKGGTHTSKNVQLTHWICNIEKSNNTISQGEQMRMF